MSVADIATTVLTHSSGLTVADMSRGAVASIALTQVTTGLTGAPGTGGTGGTGGSGDLTFVHDQTTASDDWFIAHGLGKYPSVTVIDSAGDQAEGDLIYVSATSLRIVFSAAFTGRAYLN